MLFRSVEALEKHLRNHESSRAKKDWAMARLSLDRCIQAIEAEGGDTPIQWRLWKVEMEISRGNWDTAGIAAKSVIICAFIGECIANVKLCGPAMRCEKNLIRQTYSRCEGCSCFLPRRRRRRCNTYKAHSG